MLPQFVPNPTWTSAFTCCHSEHLAVLDLFVVGPDHACNANPKSNSLTECGFIRQRFGEQPIIRCLVIVCFFPLAPSPLPRGMKSKPVSLSANTALHQVCKCVMSANTSRTQRTNSSAPCCHRSICRRSRERYAFLVCWMC